MSDVKAIRDLVGDFYSSLNDYKQDLCQKIEGQNFIIQLPVKDTFNPLPNKVLSAFYHSIAHLSVMDKKYQHFYFDKYNASNRFYLFGPGDELEISFLSAKGKLLGTSKSTVSTANLSRVASLSRNVKMKSFIIKVIKKSPIQEPNYQKQAEGLYKSLQKKLEDLLVEAHNSILDKTRRIRLGRKNNGDMITSVIIFFKSLKINLKSDETIEIWLSKLAASQINWGLKDVEELRALALVLDSYENQSDILQGKMGLTAVFKRAKAHVENTTHDYQTMLQLIKELSRP